MNTVTQVLQLVRSGGEYFIPHPDTREDATDSETSSVNDTEKAGKADENNQCSDVIRAPSRTDKPINMFGLKLDSESLRSLFLGKQETIILAGDSKLHGNQIQKQNVQILHLNDQLAYESEGPSDIARSTRTDEIQVIQQVVRSIEDLFETLGDTGSGTTYSILNEDNGCSQTSVEYEINVKFGDVRENFRNYKSGYVICKYNSGVNIQEKNNVKTGENTVQNGDALSKSGKGDDSKDLIKCMSSESDTFLCEKLGSDHNIIGDSQGDHEPPGIGEKTQEVIDKANDFTLQKGTTNNSVTSVPLVEENCDPSKNVTNSLEAERFEQIKHTPPEIYLDMINKNSLMHQPENLDLDVIDEVDENNLPAVMTKIQEEPNFDLNAVKVFNESNIFEIDEHRYTMTELQANLPATSIEMTPFPRTETEPEDNRPTTDTSSKVLVRISDSLVTITGDEQEPLSSTQNMQYEFPSNDTESLTTDDDQSITKAPSVNTVLAEPSSTNSGQVREELPSREKIRTLAVMFEPRPPTENQDTIGNV